MANFKQSRVEITMARFYKEQYNLINPVAHRMTRVRIYFTDLTEEKLKSATCRMPVLRFMNYRDLDRTLPEVVPNEIPVKLKNGWEIVL